MIELKRINLILGSDFLKQLQTEKSYIVINTIEGTLLPIQQHRYMLKLINSINNNNYRYVLTTNSPYILTTLNNAMLASQVLKLNNSNLNNKLFKIIHPNEITNIDEWTVTTVINDTFINLIDEKTGLIDADIIDKASEIIDLQYNSILDLLY